MERRTVAVIGGGAAGMMAAITAAENGARVTLFERNDRVGKKLLATGNGKCNFSNRDMGPEHYFTEMPERLESCLLQFGVLDTMSFFWKKGMMIKEKNGYLYPASEQAATVLDILRIELEKKQIRLLTGTKVDSLTKDKKSGKILVKAEGREQGFDRVIITCGSQASPKTGSDGNGYLLAKALGHRVTEIVPALVQLRCSQDYMKSVSGVRTECGVSLLVDGKKTAEERGELQITDYGISGIVVFQISRIAAYALLHKKQVKVSVDLLPHMEKEAYQKFVSDRKITLQESTVEEFFTGMLNKKLMQLFMKLAGLKAENSIKEVPGEKIDKVFSLCKEWTLSVSAVNSFDQAQVCAGGVSLEDVDENLQSRKVPGLYFAGEILDVDGKCGGYNLQWAWTSGKIAGESAAVK